MRPSARRRNDWMCRSSSCSCESPPPRESPASVLESTAPARASVDLSPIARSMARLTSLELRELSSIRVLASLSAVSPLDTAWLVLAQPLVQLPRPCAPVVSLHLPFLRARGPPRRALDSDFGALPPRPSRVDRGFESPLPRHLALDVAMRWRCRLSTWTRHVQRVSGSLEVGLPGAQPLPDAAARRRRPRGPSARRLAFHVGELAAAAGRRAGASARTESESACARAIDPGLPFWAADPPVLGSHGAPASVRVLRANRSRPRAGQREDDGEEDSGSRACDADPVGRGHPGL